MTTAVVGVRAGEARFLGADRLADRRRAGREQGLQAELEVGLARRRWTRSARTARSSTHEFAKDHHLAVGSKVRAAVPDGDEAGRSRSRASSSRRRAARRSASLTISSATFDRLYTQPQNIYTFVTTIGGVHDANTAALEQALATSRTRRSQTEHQFKDNQTSGLNTILNVLYVLLALSVIVSLFGIVNTLVLSVFERTRELGMLRAVGMTRWQVRSMITLRERDHRADRRGDRHRARHHARGAADRRALDFVALS